MEKVEQLLSRLPEGWAGPIIALATIVIGYFISKIAATIVSGAINRTTLARKAQTTGGNIGKSLAKAVFWVLWLVFILMGLSRFPQLAEPLAGIKGMLNDIFAYVPRIVSAGFIFFIGWILARIFKEAAVSTLEAAQVDTLATKLGVADEAAAKSNTIATTVGGLLFAFVLFLFGVAALGVLNIKSISEPITGMLDQVMGYLPQLISAFAVLGLSFMIGRFVSQLAQKTLPAMGVDKALSSIGELDGESSSTVVPSKIISTIILIAITLTGAIAAVDILGIERVSVIFNDLLALGGNLVFGAIIIGAGWFLANLISGIATQASGATVGKIVKYVTLLLVTFMGLNQMGIGQEIVDTAFKYVIGAAAFAGGVGGALAFGLGGRDWAKGKLGEWSPVKPKARTKTAAKK